MISAGWKFNQVRPQAPQKISSSSFFCIAHFVTALVAMRTKDILPIFRVSFVDSFAPSLVSFAMF